MPEHKWGFAESIVEISRSIGKAEACTCYFVTSITAPSVPGCDVIETPYGGSFSNHVSLPKLYGFQLAAKALLKPGESLVKWRCVKEGEIVMEVSFT